MFTDVVDADAYHQAIHSFARDGLLTRLRLDIDSAMHPQKPLRRLDLGCLVGNILATCLATFTNKCSFVRS